ncbi:hypothetical protein [Agrobacterium tumefaciens]|uniref:hypothetical protein n=1 Tax=Agrobacterium tumefaciens TaxID=358 RepID=UPI00287ED053|nr:hypothetical protein [Agrobacterium tumefaciens]MDS7596094.1 hypothetical protein [Agrobacterium tumefaciens]
MNQPLGRYYRLQSELRKRVAADKARLQGPPVNRKSGSDASMFIRLFAVVGGLLLAVSVIMQSVQ